LRQTQKSFVIVHYSKLTCKAVYLLHRSSQHPALGLPVRKEATMNAYEIEQIEKQLRADMRLPLSFNAWADFERNARQERARVVGAMISDFIVAMAAKVTGVARQVRSTAADCTQARLRHN
jgi:hypothetical protein